MHKLKFIMSYVKHPLKIIQPLGYRGLLKWMPDRLYLKLVFRSKIGKRLDIDNPKTFNEKLQWLKLFNRKPEYTMYVDKYGVRKYIANTIGQEFLIPIIGVYESVNEIPWNALPNQFVLKCTHGSHCNIVCQDKSKLDIDDAKNKLNKWLKKNWYWYGREWPYKNVKPRIICEEYLVDESEEELKDYKFMCFNGDPKIIQVMSERNNGDYCINHFDLNWNPINIPRKCHKENIKDLVRPRGLEQMIMISRTLSRNIPFARIDLYQTPTRVYFGEITFFPASGFMDFANEKDDYMLGNWLELPKKTDY